MNPVLRATAILIEPSAEWERIENEPGEPVDLLISYVAPLALIPAVFSFIGVCIIGAVVPGVGVVRASIFDGLFGAIFRYLEDFAVVMLLGAIITLLAPLFGGRKDFASACKLAVYSYTPVWLAGIFLLLPGLHFLILTGFYGAYILIAGLPLLLKSPAQKSLGFAAVIVACALVLTLLAGAAQRTVFGGPG